MDVNIRDMEERDLPAASRIYNEHAVATTYSYTSVDTTVEDRLSWWREQVADDRPVLVAEVDGALAGYANYHQFRTGGGYDVTAEVTIWLDTPARGHGVGRKLMTELILHARADHRLRNLLSVIDSENERSIGFHSAMGFTEVGRLPHIAYKFGGWRTAVLMQLAVG
ncbi:N-acetyltransferase family protein [Cutibacterium sp. WCA-380-WT-3A]|uniref:N-acetyltransferase family protein n=1 Tax=Cutibacterium porci TaxID=2605781 RepID=A0A7K0J9L7_9ACTN|nr:GNAT family N-acetyltransferase [Cutibacterium porci]MSS46674.1 N-acetyltransferase family protein [Cutibacterium porci]